MSQADLDIIVIRTAEQNRQATIRLTISGQPVSTLARDIPVIIDEASLITRSVDAKAYGQELTRQFFADERLRVAWARAVAYADGAHAQIRLRLALDSRDSALHNLRWETLCDPDPNLLTPLALNERHLFSRNLASSSLTPIVTPVRPALRTAVVVAAPANLDQYGLDEVDAEGEIARARSALGDSVAVIIGDRFEASSRRATLPNLLAALRDAPHVLLIVCHGQMNEHGALLCLEDEAGQVAWVSADAFTEAIGGLASLPLLVILAACRSGGSGYGPALSAVGPRLAQAGVPAVIAFQGDVTMGTIRRMLPPLFAELQRDGVIDRALAVARRGLGERDWWQATLWLRTPSGRLWEEAKHEEELPGVKALVGLVVDLSRAMEQDIVTDADQSGGRAMEYE